MRLCNSQTVKGVYSWTHVLPIYVVCMYVCTYVSMYIYICIYMYSMYARVCSRLMGFCVYTDSKSSVYIPTLSLALL